jgi:hypothetical protein
MWAKGPTNEAIWDVDDEEFLRAAEDHVRSYRSGSGRKEAV